MGRKVSKNKNRHLVKIMNNLGEMRSQGDHCDFIIKVGCMEYRAHKNILSAGSEYFKAMFRHDMKENQHGEVEMKEMDPECLRICIDFIYTGELDIPDGKNSGLLHASQILQLDDVRDAVIDEIEENLDVRNFFSTKQIAKLYNLPSIFKKCKEFEKENVMVISSQPEFQNEEKIEVSAILKCQEHVMSEKQKLEITINWIGEREEKKVDFFELLNLIDLTDIPPDYIKNLIEKDPLIGNDFKLYKIFNNARTEILERSLSDLTERKCQEENNKKNDCGDTKLVFFDEYANCLQVVDPETKKLTVLNETEISHLVPSNAVVLNSFVYLLYGNKSVFRLNFNDLQPKWRKMPDMLEDHGKIPSAVSALGSVFVIGGSQYVNFSENSNIVEQFDPVAERWSRQIDAPSSVRGHALVSMNELIFCLGGVIENKFSKAIREFNAITSQWTDLPPMKKAKCSFSAVAVYHRIYAFGGYGNTEWLTEVESFDAVTSQWSTMSPMSKAVGYSSACLIGGLIFVGERGRSADNIEIYDVKNNKWQKVTEFPSFEWYRFISI